MPPTASPRPPTAAESGKRSSTSALCVRGRRSGGEGEASRGRTACTPGTALLQSTTCKWSFFPSAGGERGERRASFPRPLDREAFSFQEADVERYDPQAIEPKWQRIWTD